jgi:eukaryotic-like serine/threonine-protein kinase
LGEVLTSRKKYSDAEPLLLRAYRGLKPPAGQEPEPARQLCFTETLDRLVRLYDAWGKPEEAARWRAKLPPGTPSGKSP